MTTIHAFDLLYKLWYRGSFYKNPKVRFLFMGYNDKEPVDEWANKISTMEFTFIEFMVWSIEIILLTWFFILSGVCELNASTRLWFQLSLVAVVLPTHYIAGKLCKKKNWYFNKDKLQELNESLRNEDLKWPIRVICILIFWTLSILLYGFPMITFMTYLILKFTI